LRFEIRCYVTNGLFNTAEVGLCFLFHFFFFDDTKLEWRKPVFNPKLAELPGMLLYKFLCLGRCRYCPRLH
jgi:hypothetical protein